MEESETSPILSVHISGHEHHCFNVCMCGLPFQSSEISVPLPYADPLGGVDEFALAKPGKLEYFKLLMVMEHGVENQPDTFLYQWSVVTCHIISL